ncbi:hypothetical protein N9W89_10080 [Hellea sp.]|nr:hypothetical protein [Hellea sp.]
MKMTDISMAETEIEFVGPLKPKGVTLKDRLRQIRSRSARQAGEKHWMDDLNCPKLFDNNLDLFDERLDEVLDSHQ